MGDPESTADDSDRDALTTNSGESVTNDGISEGAP
jgi:hypothetical protein